MNPPVNSYTAAKSESDQGKHNKWLVDQVTALERRVSDLEDELAKAVARKSDETSNIPVFGEDSIDFGPGTSKVQFIGNSTRPPAGTPQGGVYLYVSEGRVMVVGSSGTITELTPA